jgi:hypothetical protein
VVRDGLEIPPLGQKGGRVKSAYTKTIIAMRIGQCVDVPVERHKRAGLHQMAARFGVRVKVRRVAGENGSGDMWRVWKTELVVPSTVRWPRKRQKQDKTRARRAKGSRKSGLAHEVPGQNDCELI